MAFVGAVLRLHVRSPVAVVYGAAGRGACHPALGLSLFISLAKGWPEGGENESVAGTLLKSFAVYAAALLLGYVFHLCSVWPGAGAPGDT